ncbi:MAG TPA: CAP domain-containing protein [Candidatus Limnocylindrales bacterium]|nr:CAP domain-containing protein [Candidatus Limnocylindrales bacterium]
MVSGPAPQAPPPAPPIQIRDLPAPNDTGGPQPKGSILYSIGAPTDEEQLYLEYLNRMRANPTAEGQRLATTTDPDVLSAYSYPPYYIVDLNQLQLEFATNPPVPPVAMNAQLMAAARWHSGDMFTNVYQGHSQTNGTTVLDPGQRITANGYTWNTWGENVYAYAHYVFYGHAGFAVDWGPGPAGMQPGRGHRQNMLTAGFREVGIGVVDGVNGPGPPPDQVGPQLVTQDFATQQASTPLITGVVYYDSNGNGFYDLGEGIGGVTVNTPGSKYYAVTADSGGYVIPVTSNGNYALTFTATGLNAPMTATVSGAKNVKADYVPVYSPPTITGPNPAGLNQSNVYTFSAVGAATSYDWQQTQLSPYTIVEGAENGLGNVTAVTTGNYPVITTDLVASGTHAFHLAHPTADDQFLTLKPLLRLNAGSMLTFAKRLGLASTTQVAKAQISTDGGATWHDLWSQAGNNGSGDGAFSNISVSLAAYVGQTIQIRFAYLFQGGSYYPQTSTGIGFYFDNIAISNANQLLNPITTSIPSGTSFAFYPTNIVSYLLQVRAHINSRILNWGPALVVTVGAALPALEVASTPSVNGNQVQIDFTVSNYRTGMTFQLWKATAPSGTWTQDTSATLQTLTPNSKFRFTTSTGGASKTFYRIRGNF